VVIDIFCYRRFGHNEGDEPMFTNPAMYNRIKKHKTTLQLYTERLVKDGLIPEGEIEDMKAAFQARLNEEFEAGKEFRPNKADWLDGRWSGTLTASGRIPARPDLIKPETLQEIGAGADPRARRLRHPQDRGAPAGSQGQDVRDRRGFDWATAEALAFGSLLDRGFPVRLAGQDCTRGTFSQRHSAFIDQATEERTTR
jgi:2-oxoglutarate dehydrogenase E1 component